MHPLPWRKVVRLARDVALPIALAGVFGLSLAGCQTGGLGESAARSRPAFDSASSSSYNGQDYAGGGPGGSARPCRFG
jgi:hypothetical protein